MRQQGRTHSASRIKALRVAVRPGASAISQLAAALARRVPSRARAISVASFRFPFSPGFPVPAYPGRKVQTPLGWRRPANF